jgi:hypothetical protein
MQETVGVASQQCGEEGFGISVAFRRTVDVGDPGRCDSLRGGLFGPHQYR